jgi:hypothetical protein
MDDTHITGFIPINIVERDVRKTAEWIHPTVGVVIEELPWIMRLGVPVLDPIDIVSTIGGGVCSIEEAILVENTVAARGTAAIIVAVVVSNGTAWMRLVPNRCARWGTKVTVPVLVLPGMTRTPCSS